MRLTQGEVVATDVGPVNVPDVVDAQGGRRCGRNTEGQDGIRQIRGTVAGSVAGRGVRMWAAAWSPPWSTSKKRTSVTCVGPELDARIA